MLRILAALLTLCLAACGLKAPLVMPSGPPPEPLFGNPKPAPVPAPAPAPQNPPAAGDVSTDQKNSTQ